MSYGWKRGHTNGEIIMGTIYLITNILNDKKYVGQTIKKPEDRWKEHIYRGASDKWYKSSTITRAIHRYGVQNFRFEIIEKCEDHLLNEREEYWIEYYNSFIQGYNSTRGGQLNGGYKYNIDNEELVELYNQIGSVRKVANFYRCDKDVVSSRLKKLGIEIKPKQQLKRGDIILQNIVTKEEFVFPDKKEAAKWLIENNYSKTKNIDTVRRMNEGRIYNNEILVVSIRYSLYQ